MGDEGGAVTTLFGTEERIGALLDHTIVDKYAKLEQKGKICAEYVWIGGSGSDLRSKTKTLDKLPKSPEDLPVWNFDGSSTNQAPGIVRLVLTILQDATFCSNVLALSNARTLFS